jgi:CDP-diacylglycerol--glycerol-3-phosphate 3-phosphatidyltransferase
VNAKDLKPAVLSILRPLTTALIRSGIHPNALTALGLGISLVAAWMYGIGALGWAATVLLLAGLFDMLDGAVAREGQRMSRFGAFLDSNVDRYAEIVVFVGILWWFRGDEVTQVVTLLAITGSLMVSYTKARAEGLGQDVSGGLLQRPERIVLLALGSWFGVGGLKVVLWILALLTNLTSVQRIVYVAGAMAAEESHGDSPADDSVGVDSAEMEAAPPA